MMNELSDAYLNHEDWIVRMRLYLNIKEFIHEGLSGLKYCTCKANDHTMTMGLRRQIRK